MRVSGQDFTFATVPYANAAPLAHFLTRVRPGARVVYAPPSQLAGRLRAGQIDAALLPVPELFADESLAMIPPAGICADGPVWSVLLKCRRPPDDLRTVAPDAASIASNALARIILEDHLDLSVRFTGPGCQDADAAVVIGDRALTGPPAPCGDLDLSAQWKQMTGLPFVFAVWACRADHGGRARMRQIVADAREAGLAAIDELGAIHAARLHLPVQRCREYLTSIIHYNVGPRELEAIETFRRLWQRREAARGEPSP